MDAAGGPVAGLDIGWVLAGRRAGRPGVPREVHAVATTDAKGAYEANLLPPGPCRMVAGRPVFFFPGRVDPGGLPSTRVFRLRQGATVHAPDLRFPVEPRVLGAMDVLVVDPMGRPVRNADVHCSSLVAPWGTRRESATDSRGRIRFKGVNPGKATVSVSGASPFGGAHAVTWLPPGAHRSVRVVLPRVRRNPDSRRRIRVVCRDDTGQPLSGCRVAGRLR